MIFNVLHSKVLKKVLCLRVIVDLIFNNWNSAIECINQSFTKLVGCLAECERLMKL